MINAIDPDFLSNHPTFQSLVMLSAKHPVLTVFVLFFITLITWVLTKSFFVRRSGRGYFSTALDEWKEFSLSLGTISWALMTGIIFFIIVPFFYFVFVRPKDLLGTKMDKTSFWHKAKKVSFDLKRNYRQY